MDEPPQQTGLPRFRRSIRAAGGLVLAVGLATVGGWIGGQTGLVQLAAGLVPMQPNTALGLVVCGAGLLAIAGRARAIAALAALLVGGLGAVTLLQYVAGLDLGIDRLLGDPSISTGTSHPGRMAPNTALCFLLTGLALAGHVHALRSEARAAARAALAAGAGALAAAALIGYVTGIETAYGWGRLTQMAPQTSATLVLVATALLAAEWPHAARRVGGPRWLPLVAAVSVVTFAVCLAQALAERDVRLLDRSVGRTAQALRLGLERRLGLQIEELRQFGERWAAHHDAHRDEWELDARYFARVEPGLIGMHWVDDTMQPHWSSGGPARGAGDDPLVAGRLRGLLHAVREAGRPVFTAVYPAPAPRRAAGTAGEFMLAVPSASGRHGGIVVGAYRIEELVRSVATNMGLAGVGLAIHDGGRQVFRGGSEDERHRAARGRTLDSRLAGLGWRVELWPDRALVAAESTVLPQVALLVGLVIAALGGLTIRATQRALRSLRRLEAVNRELEREVAERRRAEAGLTGLNVTLEARVAEAVAESERRAAELQASNADLEQFAYVASHDLQEPLRAVSGFCQLLARRYRGSLDATADGFIDEILAGSERMQRMIRDLLAYSRVGRADVRREPVELASAVEAACAALRVAIDESGARVECRTPVTIEADRAQLEQLLRNLVGNSIKYRSERPPVVTVDARREGEEWLVAVRDNGIGIDPRHHARIFDVFQRLHTRDEYPGTGIGLAICRRIVERLGGRIWIESESGSGTTICFSIPSYADVVVGPTPEDASPTTEVNRFLPERLLS